MLRKRVKINSSYISESWALVKENKILYFFPLLSSIICAFLVFLCVDVLLSNYSIPHARAALTVLIIKIVGVVFYLALIPLLTNVVNAAIIFYCDALVKKSKTSIIQAFALALKRLPTLVIWTVLQVTWGVISSAIAFFVNDEIASDFIEVFFKMLWGVFAFFVLTDVLLENKPIFPTIKESRGLLQSLWRRRIIIRYGIFNLKFIMLSLVLMGLVAFALFKMQGVESFYVAGISVVLMIVLGYTVKLVTTVVRVYLYHAIKAGKNPLEQGHAAN